MRTPSDVYKILAGWNRPPKPKPKPVYLQDIVAVVTVNGTCKAFRTAEGFRKWQLENRETPGLVMAWVDGITIED